MEIYLRYSNGEIIKRNFQYVPNMFFDEMKKDVDLVKVETVHKDGIVVRDDDGKPKQKVTKLASKEKSAITEYYKMLVEKRAQGEAGPGEVGNVSRETFGKKDVQEMLADIEKTFDDRLIKLKLDSVALHNEKMKEFGEYFDEKLEKLKQLVEDLRKEFTPK